MHPNDPNLSVLATLALDVYGNGVTDLKDLKKVLKKEHFRFKDPIKTITQVPASKLRFTSLDRVRIERKVKLITEGPTDVEIINHAYSILTDGELPYWNISSSGNKSGGTHEVNKTLIQAKPILSDEEILIGIFDRDASGLKDFHMLPKNIFLDEKVNLIKKHAEANIYALCLPVPEDRANYLQKEQVFNFLEIEHYFDDDLLNSRDYTTVHGNLTCFISVDCIKVEDKIGGKMLSGG